MFLSLASIAILLLLFLYLRHVERGLQGFPEDAEKLTPHRWSDSEIKETCARVAKEPIQFAQHLPEKQDRRYVIVGGSGLVGGSILLHLLARGQSPKAIRNVDFRKPVREDLLRGQPTEVEFVQADITSSDSIRAAFEKPWDASVAKLPLTVFHNAAVIRAGDRAQRLYNIVSSVNVLGCANTIAAAKAAGADVFVATSSGSIAIRPLNIWIPPWRKYPSRFVQVYADPDKDQNIRARGQYFGNYAEAKAKAEEMVLNANTPKFRTGCIRPACGIYGNEHDLTIGAYLRSQSAMPSWIPNIAQSFVSSENVSLAHLLHEQALLTSPATTSGRSFTVTDAGFAPQFKDIYRMLGLVSSFEWVFVPSLPMLALAHVLELYTVGRLILPGFRHLLPELKGDITSLQPGLFNIACSHQIAVNDQASRFPEAGGIGYKPVHTSMEGMCQQALMYTRNIERRRNSNGVANGSLGKVVSSIKDATRPVAAKA